MIKYISSWAVFTSSLGARVARALSAAEIEEDDTVWTGPSGDAIITATAADLDDEYLDYVDSGTVAEVLADAS